MPQARFSLPDGYTYNDLRQFLESELQEDFGGRDTYLWLRDFDDATVTYSGGMDGTLYQRSYTLADSDVTWGQPAEVVAKTVYQKVAEMAAFSIDGGTDDGDFVIRRGKVFEVGEYPDKAFSLSADEARAAVAAPNDIEHRPSILDGKLGELRAVEMAEDGTGIVGSVAIPKWLNDTIGDAALKVSLAFDRATKRIAKNALVLNPRVADAALFGAYAEFAGRRHSADDQSSIQTIHDHAVKAGATCAAEMHGGDMDDAKKVTVFDTLKALFTGGDSSAPVTPPATPPARAEEPAVTDTTGTGAATAVNFTQSPEYQAMQGELATMRAERIKEKAEAFADAEIAAKRALPAERATLVAAFADAAEDDAAHPRTVTFSANGAETTGTRVDALRARHAARAPHALTEELLRDTDAQALFNATRTATADGAVSEERRKELLGKTPLGQAILAE
jgi:hypothetical protein